MRLRKKMEFVIISLLAMFSSSLAKLFAFRKVLNLSFSSFKGEGQQGEVEVLLLPYLLTKNSVFIDIGANRGLYCLYAERIVSGHNIIAFEPLPNLARLLKKLFPKTLVVQKALSDHKGEAFLNIPVHNDDYLIDTRSTLERNAPEHTQVFEKVPVELVTLDEFLDELKVEKVSLLKIDVEGHELKTLSGAKVTLQNIRPYLIVEIEPINHEGNLDNVFEYIDQFHYTIYYFDLSTTSLKLAYNSKGKFSIPLRTTNKVHNYVCFPMESDYSAKKINESIHSR